MIFGLSSDVLTYFTDQIHTYQTGRLTLVHVPSYVSGVGTKTKQGVIGIDEFPASWISFGMIVNCVRRRPMFLPIYFIYWHHRPSKICPNSWPSLCLHPETCHCRLYTCYRMRNGVTSGACMCYHIRLEAGVRIKRTHQVSKSLTLLSFVSALCKFVLAVG